VCGKRSRQSSTERTEWKGRTKSDRVLQDLREAVGGVLTVQKAGEPKLETNFLLQRLYSITLISGTIDVKNGSCRRDSDPRRAVVDMDKGDVPGRQDRRC
jgi:hypothetical protein